MTSLNQDNDLLEMEAQDLNRLRQLNKEGQHAAAFHEGPGRLMSDMASMLALSLLKNQQPITQSLMCMDFSKAEARVLSFLAGSSEEFPVILQSKKPKKHWDHLNKKKRGGLEADAAKNY